MRSAKPDQSTPVPADTAAAAGAPGRLRAWWSASVPLLLRLKRRFASWWAPAIALMVFAAMFSISAFVIGPAISGGGAGEPPVGDQPTPNSTDHSGHHD